MFEDPQVRHVGMVAEVEQPGSGKVKMLTFPGRASATPPRIDRPAPFLGQHTAEVLEELGLSREEIDRLAAAGVIVLGEKSRVVTLVINPALESRIPAPVRARIVMAPRPVMYAW